jgi:ribosomal protein S18 acetylase RimI-like enzyme
MNASVQCLRQNANGPWGTAPGASRITAARHTLCVYVRQASRSKMTKTCIIHPLVAADQPDLWEMLYQALYIPLGQQPPSRALVQHPDLARYVAHWGRPGDRGFVARQSTSVPTAIGAIWLRLLIGAEKGFGYVDETTPELGIALLPRYRGQGVGSALLARLVEEVDTPMSLSVAAENPAVRLYRRFGFVTMAERDGSLIMKRG